MNNFSDLLATNSQLTVIVDGQTTYYDLFDTIVLDSNKSATINGYEILPKYHYLAQDNLLTIPGPFYSWLHEHSGQGWLLIPDKLS